MNTDSANPTTIMEIRGNIDAFELALEEQFKPALLKAIADVLAEFLSSDVFGLTVEEVTE